MADWWTEYKKKNKLEESAERARQVETASRSQSSGSSKSTSGGSGQYEVSKQAQEAAKDPNWWEDYKQKNGLSDSYNRAAAQAEYSKRLQQLRQEEYSRYKAAQAKLEASQRTNKRSQVMLQGFHKDPLQQAASELELRDMQYKQNLPLYEEVLKNTAYNPNLRQNIVDQARKEYDEYTGAFQKYNDADAAQKKAREDYLNELQNTNRSQYYAETMTREQIEQKLGQLARDKGRAVAYADRASELAGSDQDRAKVYSSQAGDGRQPDYMRQLWDANAQNDELDAEIARYQAALKYRNSLDRDAEMEELARNISSLSNFREMSEVGRAMVENRNKSARASVNSMDYQPDDPDDNRQFAKAERQEREALSKAGYVSDLDSSYIPEEVKPIYYALFVQSPQKAQEFAAYWAEKGEQARWNELYQQSGEDAGERFKAFIEGTFANTAAGLDPFGEGGQYAAKLGKTMIGGGAAGLTEKGFFNSGKGAGVWHTDLFGDISLGSAYQLGSSMLQSFGNAALAKMTGGAAGFTGGLGTILLGSSAAAQDYQEKLEQGWDESAAKLHALAAGTAESLFEYVSMDKLIKEPLKLGVGAKWRDIIKQGVRNFFVQGGVEASEEVSTTLANRVTDALISELSGNESQIQAKVRELMEQGYEKGTAEKMAEQEWLTEVMSDALGGFLSGGLMSSGQYAMYPVYKAMGAVETRRANERTGALSSRTGEAAALAQYAADNNLEWASQEQLAEAVNPGDGGNESNLNESTLGRQVSEAAEQRKTRQELRQERRTNRQTGEDVNRARSHIQEQLAGKTVQEQQAIRDELVKKYGAGMELPVYRAVSMETAKQAMELESTDAIRQARETVLAEIQDEDMKRAVAEGYDQAAYQKAAQSNDLNAAAKYIQQVRNTGRGGMSMTATVTGEDGQSRQVRIADMTEDGKGVKLEDGTVVAAKDLVADADTMDVVKQLSRLNLGKDAGAVLQAFRDSGVAESEGYRWIMDYATAYEQGRTARISLKQAVERSSLDAKTVMDAYTKGRQYAQAETEKAEERKNKARKKGVTGRKSNIDTSELTRKGITYEKMTRAERQQYDLANKIFELIGVDLKWIASDIKTDSKGQQYYSGVNGSYLNGVVTLDIHAGQNYVEALRSGVLATTGHELTHFLEQYAPKQYKALKEFVFQQIVENSANGEQTLERMIWEKQKRSNFRISAREAEHEVVADACQEMLLDSEAIREFAAENEEAAKGMVRWLRDFFARIKAAFKQSTELTEQAQFMAGLEKDVRKAFGKLWDEALREAVKAHDEIGNMEGNADQYSLRDVEPVEPSSDAWSRSATFAEVKAKHPTLFALDADESDTRNPTQVKVTVSTYRKIYNMLKAEGFNGTILDASSGLGLGTETGRKEFGFDVDDIEPFPDKSYKPRYTDYSTLNKQYDVVISNAVLNVLTQDLRDAMVVKIGEMLKPGGRAFINVRGDDVLNAGSKVAINEDGMEYFISNTGSYQKGFTRNELKAYLEDALGDGFTVKIRKDFGKVSAEVIRDGGKAQHSERDYMKAVENGDMETAQRIVDEKAKQAGYPLKLMHGTNSFGFTTVNFNESDDKVSFFATDNEEVAGSYVRPMDDYDDEPSTYVRPIGKPVKNRITQSSSVGDILAELKRLAPDSYRDTNAATKAQIQEKVDEQLSYVRDIARQLDRFSLPERLQTMAQKVMEAKSAQVAVELVESVDDIHEIISNGMYFEQAMSKLDNLRANTNTLKKWAALTPETVAIRTIGNRTSLVDKNHLYDAYLDNTGLSGRGIYEIYTTENNPLRINCRGNRWNNIPLSGEMAADIGERSTTREISKWAHDHGYGMVEFDNVKDTGKYGSQFTPASTVYAFLEGGGNNFKSADAVTYDDNGDVIPLSERFSDKNELRYSERDESVLTPDEARRLLDGRAQEDLDKLYAEFAEAINAPKSLDPKQIYNLYRKDVENDKVSYGRGTTELKRGREIIRKITALETSLQQFMDDLQNVPVDEFTVRLTPPNEYGLYASESVIDFMYSGERMVRKAEKLQQEFLRGDRKDENRFREFVKKLYALHQEAGEPFYAYGVEYNPKGKPDTDTKYSDRENPKPRSAQAQRDAGYKLSESKFYSLYFAHKLDLRHRGDVLDQIENIKAEGFKGDGGFGNNVMPSRQYVSYPYREKYKLIKELEEKGGYGFEPGYADRWKAELGDEFDKPFPENLSVKAYGPRKGEYILLVPKSGVEFRGSGYFTSERVRPGYKPDFAYEFVQCEYDFQPYYEMYSKAYDRVMAAQKVNVDIDSMTQSAAPSDTTKYSERTWTASRFVQDRENAAKALAKALGVTQKQAEKYIDDINSVARAISDDRVRLDYMSSPGRSAFKSNVEYGGSIDFSTLCKKRQLLTGTFNAIQHALANTVMTAEDVLRIRQMMQDAGLEVNCGMCYVEGSRARMGEYNKTFLELYKKYFPDNWQPKMEDVNTTDGLELMRMEHPECYEQYEHFYNNHGTLRSEDKAIFSSQAKPKEYQLRTEYKGEIKEKFQKDSTVETKNRNGGLRMQSFSDFEIVHLIDCMQVIMDMSEVGLAGQAYTKVPEFAEALGLTGLKINLSLVAKGVDKNGKLIFNDVEGMPHERAFGIREKYSENVGTILVVYDDAQLLAALADDKVDYIIPFHRSQWRKSQYAAMGLPKTTKDYTYQQNEKWLNPKDHTHKYRDKVVPTKCTNYMPNEYWDFSLSGTENARRYLEMCAKDGKRPKFYKLLQNNGDGSFSLKADGSTDGFWKLLIDFKMYDNNGVGVPQMPVQPIFDMENAMQMLADYSGDPSRFPVAQGIVDEFVSQYKAEHPGRQYSERDYSQKSDYEILRELDPMTAASNEELRKNLEMVQKRIDKVRSQQYELNGLRKKIAAATGEKRAALEQKAKVLQGKITGNVREIDKSLNTSSMQNLLKAQRAEARKIATQQFMDRRGKKNIRDRIKNLHAEMNRDLLRPREGHFVPEALIRPVVDLLNLVNTQTNRAKSESAQARIDAINAAYDKIRNDERYSMYYDETVKGMLVELSATLAGRNIYELSADELSDVYTAMKAMRTTIRNAILADLIEKGKEIFEVGNELRQELRNGRGASPYLIEKYHMAMLSGKRAFNRFGGYRQSSTWNKVYKMLDDAQLKMLNLEMLATRIFDPVLKAKEDFEKAQDLTSIKEKDLVDVGLKDADGNAVKITRGMMLGLYMHLQNEENMRHIMYGGLTLPDFKRYYKGSDEAWGRGTVEIPALGAKVSNLEQLLEEQGEAWVDEKYAEYKAEIEELFESVRQNIEEQLTDYDRKWIAASKDFFDNFSRRELNAVTNAMYGFSKAKVDNYFPIVTDSNFLKSEFDSISKNISLENAGFMKERVKASNPILLEDITRTVNRQISNVSRYAGLTQALKQFGNVYNVQTKGFTDSVKKAMAKSYGKNGQAYVQNLITDMIGGRSTPGTIFDRIKGNYAQAVLSANFSVTIKQAASFPTAAATVGWGPIMKALAKGGRNGRLISRADRALIDTYSPLLWKRSQGAIDTEIGDMAHAQDWTKKAKWLMGWIEKTDIATVGRLWYAAEYYVKDNFNLEKGTEEQIRNGESPFYQKVAEVFTDIVEDTQPNYTVLQRPDILRNPNKLVRAMTMFSTQRFQNANILIDAVGEYDAMRRADKKAGTGESKAARTEARKKLTRAISSQVVSAVVLNVMTLVGAALLHRMNPWRDDDDEITASSIAEEYLNGFLSTMAGSFLGGSELYEAVSSLLTGSKYYGNDVGGISTINEFATSVVEFGQKAVKLIGDEESKPEDWSNLAKKQLWKVGEYLSQMTGVPVANIRKILEGGRDHIIDAVNGEFFSFEAGVDRSNATNARRFYMAWETGDKEKMQKVLEEVRRSGKSEDSVANAFNKAAREAYQSDEISLERYAEYLEKTGMFDGEKIAGKLKAIVKEEYQAGERSEDATIDVLTNLCGMDGNKAWKTVQEWEAKAEHADDEDYSYSQYEDLREALDAGKSLKEAGADYLAHGYSEKQITDAAVDHLKDRYLAGEISEDEAVKAWAEYKDKDENDAWMAVQRWEGTAAHADEEDYSFSQYDAIDEAIAANQDIKALVKELTDHGVEEKNITSHVKSYLVDRYVAGGVTESALKNQLSRYLGIVAKDDVDKILNDANSKKQYGVAYSSLDEEYRAGKIKASEMRNALMKYGGLSAADADKKIRWYDLQKQNPDLEISESKANTWYDGTSYTKTNGHESAKAAGLSIQDYLRAKDELAKVKGVDANNDGRTDTGSREIAYIRALTAMSWLTDRQRRALYYEEYKGTSKTSGRPW